MDRAASVDKPPPRVLAVGGYRHLTMRRAATQLRPAFDLPHCNPQRERRQINLDVARLESGESVGAQPKDDGEADVGDAHHRFSTFAHCSADREPQPRRLIVKRSYENVYKHITRFLNLFAKNCSFG